MIPDSPEYGSGIGFFTGAFGGSRGFGCGDLRHEVIRSVVFEAGNQFAFRNFEKGDVKEVFILAI